MAPRVFADVIKAVLAVVPESETTFRADLEKVARDAVYIAPETREAWLRAEHAFERQFGDVPPATGWGAQAVAIFKGEAS